MSLTESRIQNPESRIPNPESRVPNPRSQIPNPQSPISNPKSQSQIPNPQSQIRNPTTQNPKPKTQISNLKSQISNLKISNPTKAARLYLGSACSAKNSSMILTHRRLTSLYGADHPRLQLCFYSRFAIALMAAQPRKLARSRRLNCRAVRPVLKGQPATCSVRDRNSPFG